MKDKKLLVETFSNVRRQNFYWLVLPDVRDPGFYRDATAFNAFFNSLRNPHANVTDVRQFSAKCSDEVCHYTRMWGVTLRSKLPTFVGMKAFYTHIGYDPKTRSYASGERLKRFSLDRGFYLPGTRRPKP